MTGESFYIPKNGDVYYIKSCPHLHFIRYYPTKDVMCEVIESTHDNQIGRYEIYFDFLIDVTEKDLKLSLEYILEYCYTEKEEQLASDIYRRLQNDVISVDFYFNYINSSKLIKNCLDYWPDRNSSGTTVAMIESSNTLTEYMIKTFPEIKSGTNIGSDVLYQISDTIQASNHSFFENNLHESHRPVFVRNIFKQDELIHPQIPLERNGF